MEFYVTERVVPVVQLVVRGGPGTVHTVARLPASVPVVVMAATGGAAEMILQTCRQVSSGQSKDARTEKAPQWDEATLDGFHKIQQANEKNPQKFWFFHPSLPEYDSLDGKAPSNEVTPWHRLHWDVPMGRSEGGL